MPFSTLPDSGNALWESAYRRALARFGGNKTMAAKSAWGAVKRAYKKKGDRWVKKSNLEMAAGLILENHKSTKF